ncbi:MAG: hypothetical protein KBC16_02960 [Candidatus Pacebacteria bacterium]|nr:hypothetical protein [Candidatus Paceibacterota bacterium]
MATALEDSSGVDAIASLDVGEVNIQIKSSVTGVYKHMLKYGNKHLIIVVTPGKTPEVVRREVYIHLRNFRDGRLAEISRK